jgi:peptidoglycan/xylan/chitin deacetylase (PgdA/CDA1 family)
MAENHGDLAYTYDIVDMAPEVEEIIDRGWEVGLHGGFTTYLNEQEMREKKERLERVTSRTVLGYRNHYLCFRVPETWEYLSRVGIKYDSTLGYADCAGFRNGMCHPYNPFNRNTADEIDILEIPLTLMDGTLDNTYMRLGDAEKWDLIKMLIDSVAKCRGVFTLLWHNTFITGGANLRLYNKILQYASEKNAWITSGAEILSLMPP